MERKKGFHTGSGRTVSYQFTVPAGAVIGNSLARVRLSSSGGLPPRPGAGGNQPKARWKTTWWPSTRGRTRPSIGAMRRKPGRPYPTLATSNGARHIASPNFCLGNLIDAEPERPAEPNATGDDLNGNPTTRTA